MRVMNEILADIVVTAGGTVTDPHNRNQLLRDWLAALDPSFESPLIEPPEVVQHASSNAINIGTTYSLTNNSAITEL